MLAFTVEFSANLSLPDYIGLGAGVSEGFGVVRRQRTVGGRRRTADGKEVEAEI